MLDNKAERTKSEELSRLRSVILRHVIELDKKLSEQLSLVVENKNFQLMEARWSNLLDLVSHCQNNDIVKIKLLDFSWNDINDDLTAHEKIRQTNLFRLIGSQHFETLGGEPFGIVAIDHYLSLDIDSDIDDFYLALLVSDLASACICPFILSLSPDFFGSKEASWLTDKERIRNLIKGDEYEQWHALKQHESACFLGIVFPQIKIRSRYQDVDIGFRFHQTPSMSTGLWGNACFGFLKTTIDNFYCYSWFGFMKLVPSHNEIGALIPRANKDRDVELDQAYQTQIKLTQDLADFYSDFGLIPVATSVLSHDLFFVGNRSVYECGGSVYKVVITQLQSMLILCRIVHYTKIHIRAFIGQAMTYSECEIVLNNWLQNYVGIVSEASSDVLAQYPLKYATAKVRESLKGSSRFECDITICPQYQVDYILGELTLSTFLGEHAPR